MPTTLQRMRVLALAGLFLTLSTWARAQPAPAPKLDPQTIEVAKGALERARKAWGSARLLEGGGASASGSAATAGHVMLTSEAAAAGVALVQAAGLIGATAGATHLYMTRVGSIVRYGTPYGASAEDIAFPLRRKLREQRPAVPEPFPVPEPLPEDGEPLEKQPGRVYVTYTRYNRTTGRYYSGRTSAVIDLNQNWERQAEAAVRARHGDRDPDQEPDPTAPGFRNALLDTYAVGRAVDFGQRYRDLGYLAIRGREQQLIDYHGARRAKARGIEDFDGGARSDTDPNEPLTENKIRAVARDNPMGEFFHEAANLRFGELAPYTGDRRF